MSYAAAFLFAALIPAFLVSLLGQSLRLAPYAFGVALAHAVVLGLPLFLIFQAKRWVNIYSSTVLGGVVGALPGSIMFWPLWSAGGSASVGGIPTLIDGVPTLAGWINYFWLLLTLGGFGALSGFTFWLVLRLSRVTPTNVAIPTNQKSIPLISIRGAGIAGVAVALTGFVVAIPSIVKDRTCHNMFRDGRTSIGPEVATDLNVPRDQWPTLVRLFENLGREHGLSFRDSSVERPGMAHLFLSLCNDDGVNILANQMRLDSRTISERGISVVIYTVVDNADWQSITKSLVGEIETTWPGRLTFTGPDGRQTSPPPELSTSTP